MLSVATVTLTGSHSDSGSMMPAPGLGTPRLGRHGWNFKVEGSQADSESLSLSGGTVTPTG
eukprot:1461849-Rhodomonas_salina.1